MKTPLAGSAYRWAGVVLLLVATGCATQGPVGGDAAKSKEGEFDLQDGQLMRGGKPYVMYAFETPDLMAPGEDEIAMSYTLNPGAAVGAASVCFDLKGFSKDGKTLSSEGAARAKEIAKILKDRQMTALCRVLGPDAPQNATGRKAAVRAAAKALKDQTGMVYWIDGAASSQLAEVFHKTAPKLVTASAKGGMIDVVKDTKDIEPKRPTLLVGAIPERDQKNVVACVLPASSEWYAKLDKALADPFESEPWTPDNSVLSEEERKDGWIALFDGKTFNGWTITGDKSCWTIKDGTIEWVKKGGGVIRSRDRYADYMLRFEYKIEEGGNSGVFQRAPRAARQSRTGFEFQILGDYGKEPDKNSTGSVYDVIPPKCNASKPSGEWNSVELCVKGPQYRATLNGQVIQDLNFDDIPALKPRLRNGFIALQDHDHYAAFRNIRIKPM